MKTLMLAAAGAMSLAGASFAETWDMPMAYSGSNFHSVTGAEFAQCVTTGTGGEIEIVTHPSGSMFKGGDIKRAIQTGQAPIGGRSPWAISRRSGVWRASGAARCRARRG